VCVRLAYRHGVDYPGSDRSLPFEPAGMVRPS
jgi:hypothetical protein